MATVPAARRNPIPSRSQQQAEKPAEEDGIKGKLAAIKTKLEQHAAGRVLLSTVEGYKKDDLPTQAGAMTYFGIFSLFPLILVFMALAGLALQSNDNAREQILNVVTGFLPQGQDQLQKLVASVIQAKQVAGLVGILTLLWSALGWFQVIDNNVNRIWGVTKPRSFIKGKLFALAMVAAIGGVAGLSFGATAAINILAQFTDLIPGSAVLWQIVVSVVSVLVIALAFYLLYRYTPRRDIRAADVWPAALVTAVIWEATRRLLTFYFQQTDMISGYGPIGAVMALLFWIYVASTIILVGAELSYAVAKERRHIEPEDELQVVAPPGEQPTPKFAPQVGAGHSTGQDEDEPIRPHKPGVATREAAHRSASGSATGSAARSSGAATSHAGSDSAAAARSSGAAASHAGSGSAAASGFATQTRPHTERPSHPLGLSSILSGALAVGLFALRHAVGRHHDTHSRSAAHPR
jgi:membrane protein